MVWNQNVLETLYNFIQAERKKLDLNSLKPSNTQETK